MGHYRSEMGYEDQDAKEAMIYEKRLKNTKKNIQKAIDKDGIAAVLAEIVIDAKVHNWIAW